MSHAAVLLLAVAFVCFPATGAPAQPEKTFADDPEAHALYDRMVEAMRAAETLSFTSRYRWEARGKEIGSCTYTLRLKKPNQFRMDTMRKDEKKGGILVGDGDRLWIHWPNGRPFFSTEDPKTYNQPRTNQYYTQRTPLGRHSIAHQTSLLGAGMSMTILDASTFHGYTDSLQRYVDGVAGKGTAVVEGEDCDAIFASIMKGQRTWTLWLSRRDHLPRKLRQVIHVSYDIITEEAWSDIKVNADIPAALFAWKPPAGWTEWKKPSPADRLLKPGEVAPGFTLTLRSGEKASLADFKGKVVWLNIWRAG